VIGRAAVQPDADMKIDLLESLHPPGTAAVNDLTGPGMIRIIADVLNKQVARRPDVPFKRQCRFEDRIECMLARKPGDGEHPVERPVFIQSSRPGKLDVRIVAVAGNFAGSGGEA